MDSDAVVGGVWPDIVILSVIAPSAVGFAMVVFVLWACESAAYICVCVCEECAWVDSC
jgi:hypothetical protein